MIEIIVAPDETREEVWELYEDYAAELAKLYDEKTRRHAHYTACFDEYWEQNRRTPFLIIYDHELTGFCLLTDTGTRYVVDEFYVSPLHRRRGFGRVAVEQILSYCRQEGRHKTVGAYVQVGNTDAINFWKSLGFHDTGRRTRVGGQRLIETEMDLEKPSAV